MTMFVSKDGYAVYVESDGDDMWVSVRRHGKRLHECIVGCVGDYDRAKDYVREAYRQFYPANYVSEWMDAKDSRQRVIALAQEACGIDYALEMAMSV